VNEAIIIVHETVLETLTSTF